MKTIAAVLLAFGLFGYLELAAWSQEKKEDKGDEKKEDKKNDVKVAAPNLEGKYKLVFGKKNVDAEKKKEEVFGDDAKKWDYEFTADKITIKSPDLKFVMSYKIDPTKNPMHIDMEIAEGPDGTKGAKASGIIELKGDTLKLVYMMEKDKRPMSFDSKEKDSMMFELKKIK